MSFERKVQRRIARAYQEIVESAKASPDGKHHILTTQVEIRAALRMMPLPPSAPGAADGGDRDEVDPIAYRREKNAAKRARRARRG